MATNNFLPFTPTDTGTNLLTQSEYLAATDRTTGNQPGIASSKLNNKAIRQANVLASQLAQFVCNKTGLDMLDDGDLADILTGLNAAFAPPTQQYNIANLTLATSVATSALTIAVKTQANANPSATDPIVVGMRSATLTSGLYNSRTLSSALSLVVPSGATLGQLNGVAANIYVYLIDNSGTLELAVSGSRYAENQLISTTTISSGATNPTTVYSTTGRSNVSFRLVGYILNTQSTAGTWASAGDQVQLLPVQEDTLSTSFSGYRKPVLVFNSTTTVNIENNTGTANQTMVVFPNGNIRSVIENLGSTQKYRRFDITLTAEFTSGTEASGLLSGISRTTNTWYALYAVKSQINAANFVLVGTTTIPVQANYSSLNASFGVNAWIYLGMIRNGDQTGATNAILDFNQTKNSTTFLNSCTYTSTLVAAGIQMSTTTGWTAATGTSGQTIPSHLKQGSWLFHAAPSAGAVIGVSSGGNLVSQSSASSGQPWSSTWQGTVEKTLAASIAGGSFNYSEFGLCGFLDNLV